MEIKGTNFTLREWRTGDAASLQKHADNVKIFNGLLDRFPSPYTMDDAINWINLMQNQNPMLYFAIDIEGKLVGSIGLEMKDDVYRKTALIGYWLGEAFWGRGIMSEAVKLISKYAFETLGLSRLQAGVFGNNPKSMRVLEMAGFVKEAVLTNSVIKNGVVLDEHLFALLRGNG